MGCRAFQAEGTASAQVFSWERGEKGIREIVGGGVNGARHKVPLRLVRIWTLRVEESRKVSFSLIL